MKQYLEILRKINQNGEILMDRTEVGTKSIFGVMFEHDMRDGFPLLTTKKVNPNTIFVELEGFIKGITDKRWYQERKCFIWDEWCNPQALSKYDWNDLYSVIRSIRDQHRSNPSLSPKVDHELNAYAFEAFDDHLIFKLLTIDAINEELEPSRDDIRKLAQLYENDLGPVYGFQWRHFGKQYSYDKTNDAEYAFNGWGGVDQLMKVVETLKTKPTDRRMIVSAWNPIEVDKNTVALPACHYGFQLNSNGTDLDLMYNIRSQDVFLGMPFNIASYAMLLILIARETGLTPRYLKSCIGNAHIYMNHMEQVDLQLSREPRNLPTLTIPDDGTSMFDWKYDKFTMNGYDPHPFIKAPVAV